MTFRNNMSNWLESGIQNGTNGILQINHDGVMQPEVEQSYFYRLEFPRICFIPQFLYLDNTNK